MTGAREPVDGHLSGQGAPRRRQRRRRARRPSCSAWRRTPSASPTRCSASSREKPRSSRSSASRASSNGWPAARPIVYFSGGPAHHLGPGADLPLGHQRGQPGQRQHLRGRRAGPHHGLRVHGGAGHDQAGGRVGAPADDLTGIRGGDARRSHGRRDGRGVAPREYPGHPGRPGPGHGRVPHCQHQQPQVGPRAHGRRRHGLLRGRLRPAHADLRRRLSQGRGQGRPRPA